MPSNAWPSIDPGRFRHRITLLAPVAGSDASGSVVTYAASDPPVTAWADVEYTRGTDLIKAGQDVSQVFAKVTMHYRTQFVVSNRIQLPSGNQLIIQAVESVRDMNIYTVLTCIGIGANN